MRTLKLEVVAGSCAARPVARRETAGFEPKNGQKTAFCVEQNRHLQVSVCGFRSSWPELRLPTRHPAACACAALQLLRICSQYCTHASIECSLSPCEKLTLPLIWGVRLSAVVRKRHATAASTETPAAPHTTASTPAGESCPADENDVH
jgi:hypothetical protein